MYSPKFTYSDKLVQNLVKVEHNKTILQNLDLSYNIRHKITEKSRALDLFHFANILKSEITLKDAEKLMASQRIEALDEIRFTIVKNFKNALDFSRSSIADTYSEIDKNVILHINKLMLAQWRETWEADLRKFKDTIDDRWDSFVTLRDEDIQSDQLSKELDELIEWYKFSIPTITPLVRIAVVFYRLIELAPFIAGNKFTIAAIIDYLLLKNGYCSKVYSSFIRIIDQQEEKFIKNANVVKSTHDLAFFIDAFTSGMADELTNVRKEIDKYIVKEEKSKEQPFLNLNKRQLKVLKYLQNVPKIKREDYCHMMEVSTMTAFRDLSDLVRKKLLKVEGKGRGTSYKLASY